MPKLVPRGEVREESGQGVPSLFVPHQHDPHIFTVKGFIPGVPVIPPDPADTAVLHGIGDNLRIDFQGRGRQVFHQAAERLHDLRFELGLVLFVKFTAVVKTIFRQQPYGFRPDARKTVHFGSSFCQQRNKE